jgi:hypothetical protein
MLIIGFFGMINAAAAAVLLARNHVVGWLTLAPVIIIALPIFGIPFANNYFLKPYEIVVFHRMLFAIPCGLASVILVADLLNRKRVAVRDYPNDAKPTPLFFRLLAGNFFTLLLVILIALPSSPRSGDRTWQSFSRVPDDLWLRPVWEIAGAYKQRTTGTATVYTLVTCIPGSVLVNLNTKHPVNSGRYNRNTANPLTDLIGVRRIVETRPDQVKISDALLIEPTAFFTNGSIAGQLSGHWTAQEAPLAAAGTLEFRHLLLLNGFRPDASPLGTSFRPPELEHP